jgi:Domain of unknown function (DUF4258)
LILYSRHAREQMVARGISVELVAEAIKKGSRQLQNPDRVLYSYGYFVVVTRKSGADYFVITVKPRW